MPVRLANAGYIAMVKETTKGVVPSVPGIYIPYYDDTMLTDTQVDEDTPIMGNKSKRFASLLGMRAHKGEITFKAEPNTAGHLMNMLLTKGTTTGAGPYTHPFTADIATDPKSYTIDIAKGQVVHRYMGFELSQLGNDFDENKMILKATGSALKSFISREISGVSGTTVTLKTDYDASPTTGLFAGDLIRIVKASDLSAQDFTVSSITNATQFVASGSPSSIVDGDMLFIRPATPSFALKTDFLWARTEVCFGATASAALSASQFRMDELKWNIMHEFEDENGAARSGSYDPAALNRTLAGIEVDFKRFFDDPLDMNLYLQAKKRAMVIRHYSETGYEMRLTLNNFKYHEFKNDTNSEEPIYVEGKMATDYDTTDGQAFDVKVLNNLSTI